MRQPFFVDNGQFLPFHCIGAAPETVGAPPTAVGEGPAPVGGPPTYVGEIGGAVGTVAIPVGDPADHEGGCPISEGAENQTIVEFITAKDGKLHIVLPDKDIKPVKVEAQSITATGGTREKPVKLEVTKSENGFIIMAPKSGEWLILQYRESSSAKPITARMNYDQKACGTCKSPEWLCACASKK